MALTENDYQEIRNELNTTQKPLILLDDDTDGICSYLQLYKYMNKGLGIIADGYIDERYTDVVKHYNPDKVFIVDKAIIKQEFIDSIKQPIISIDHHQPLKLKNIKYYNPMNSEPKENPPASHITYQATKKSLWIATIGTIADSHITNTIKEFAQQYPDIITKNEKINEQIFLNPKIRQLVLTFEFGLLGTEKEKNNFLNLLKKINSPYEILNSETEAGRQINQIYQKHNEKYEELLEIARKNKKDDSKFIILRYENKYGFSSQLSNQLLYENKDKIIIIARKKETNTVMSLRGAGQNKILPALQQAKQGLNMMGGGHLYACGSSIINEQFELFLENFKKQF